MRADQAIYIYKCECLRIKDGDTIEADIDRGFRERWTMPIRFTGINCWEIKGAEKPYGHMAAAYLQSLFVKYGKWFYLHSDRDEIAIYNRVGGRCYIPFGSVFVDVVESMKRAGMEKPNGVPDTGVDPVFINEPSITTLVRKKLKQ